jgi:succinate dehydrogenase / fumarate reductase flavoprotein subunit
VELFSFVPVKRSHSVCAQGGINGAVNTKGEGDSPVLHVKDTLKGGDFLAEQVAVNGMCNAAPGIIYLLDRMGVPFNRTSEGLLDFRRFGGTMHHRTAFAGATTGQQLLYALDEQVRRYEAEGKVKKYEYWEFLGIVREDGGPCRGIVAMDLRTMEVKSFGADAVCLATGGPGIVFGRSTNSIINTGTAAASVYLDGAIYSNAEFIQVHPTAIPGDDKLRLMSESVRGEGGKVWVPSDGGFDQRSGKQRPPKGQPWYFLEEWYPKYKNLVPRDIATREIFDVCRNLKLGVDGQDAVYLDVTAIGSVGHDKIKGVLEIYEKFQGVDPRTHPMKIFPAMHYSMGGLWVDVEADGKLMPKDKSPRNQSTNIPGLYAAGECDYAYHGANRLGANSLLSCIYSGQITGPAMISYAGNLKPSGDAQGALQQTQRRWQERFANIKKMDGKENPYAIGRELGDWMTANVTVVRENKKLQETLEHIAGLKARWQNASVLDTGGTLNQPMSYMNQLWNMLELGELITKCALMRDECRGAHYKPEFKMDAPVGPDGKTVTPQGSSVPPQEDPKWMAKWTEQKDKWLKFTMATWTKSGPNVYYEPIKTPVLEPEPRYYA